MQIWIHDNKMKKIVALNNDIPDMLSYTNSSWHSYLDQATSTFDFTIPKFSNGELHEDLKLINDECFVSFYVNGSYQVFYIATLQEDDFNIQLTCNNTNLEYALEYANPFSSDSAQTIEWYLNKMYFLSYAAVEIGNNEISDRKRTLTFDSQETKMNRLQSLMSKFEAEFEFKVELNRDGTYKRIVINIYQENHIGTDRKDVVLYYSNGLKGVQVNSDKTQMFTSGIFTGKDGLNLANVEISEKNSDGIEEFYSRKGDVYLRAPLAMQRYPSTMRVEGQDNWINKDFQTEYENVNDLKAYALRTLKKYAYPLVTYTASVQSGFVSHYTDLKLGDTIRIIDKNFVGGLALEARVSEMIISFDNPANNSFVFTNYRKLDNKPSSALQTRIEQAVESKLPYRIELATTGGVTFKNNEGETIVKPSLYKGNLPYTTDVTWRWTLNSIVTDGMQYRIQARDITDTAVLTVDAFVGGKKVATTEITFTNVNDGPQGPQGPQGDEGPQGPQGDTGNGIANTVITYGLSMSDTTEPATWSSEMPALVKGMYLWTRTVIIYTNGGSTTSYQISYIAKDADATAEIDKTKQELLEKLETVRDDSLAAVEEAKQELVTVRDESLAAAEEAKQGLINVNTKVDNAKAELTQTKQQLTTVSDDLSKAKTDLQNAVSAVDTKATNLKNDLTQAKQDLNSQAQQLQAQANAQSELTKRVSSVEKTADGTKMTVSELSKTVAQNGKDITSVTNRTKTVEDDLSGTKTTLSQVKTTADSTSQKTATLETGLNGLNAKFDNLRVGGANLLLYSADPSKAPSGYYDFAGAQKTSETYNGSVVYRVQSAWNGLRINLGNLVDRGLLKVGDVLTYSVAMRAEQATQIQARLFIRYTNQSGADSPTGKMEIVNLTANWQYVSVTFTVTAKMLAENTKVTYLGWELTSNAESGKYVYYACNKIERGNIATDYSPNDADLEQKVAEYKQTADQNYASLQTTVQNLDGTVQHNKTTAEQTAAGFKARIESLETYKDGESERANAYFESAKTETAKQLTAERTAIANNYVAKSTYTSDVTGIRNELSATTSTANATKTNLANYQASNDKMVASLKSSLQTTDGNVSNLQTKVEAVPGQITSAVSAVEGKIPKNVSTRNLVLKSNDFAKPHKQSGANTTVTSTDNYFIIKSTGYTANAFGGISWNMSISEVKAGEQFSILMPVYIDSSIALDGAFGFNIKNHPLNLAAYGYDIPTNKKNEWFNVAITFKASKDVVFDTYPFYVFIVKNGLVRIKPPMLVRGNLIPSDYQPAFEDTESDINAVSSELKQTADGMTLLATKTELSTAKNELQSGINTATNKANNAQSTANSNAQTISTHTTQISALNTGLQAKVSQSDFNTLSGRVTTAENNITAKANELSSKITSVEGKIPTAIGSTNLLLYSVDPWKAPDGYYQFDGVTKTDKTLNGSVVYKTNTAWNSLRSNWGKHLIDRKNVKVGDEFTYSIYAKTDQTSIRTRLYIRLSGQSSAEAWTSEITLTNEWKKLSVTFKVTQKMVASQTKLSWVGFEQTSNSENGKFVYYACNKLERGNIATDYSPAPEDTVEQINSVSSELKQTADGITLLATKTELNNAKNELQSGITTATNKANAAQNTANSNAQTISTHTTQISALNTGLQAKVSQSDFNTLSGRVTTAENNITAKANELTSKITSVEGKIPTGIGAVNLFKGSRDFSGSWMDGGSGAYAEDYKGVKIFKKNSAWGGLSQEFEAKTGEEYIFSAYVKSSVKTDRVTFYLPHPSKQPTATGFVGFDSTNRQNDVSFDLTDEYQRIAIKIKITKDGWIAPRIERGNTNAYLFFGGYKLERGNIATDYSPAPEDTISQIDAVSSELKQTKDGITLLATKTELNTAKSDLQSGITTATNKANSAQSTANNNAQTINTHTTQISALNTGLQAKVSQTDFNTLSGRVTTAENNITAKANELSSKISSVEGKIPTAIGSTNLLLYSVDPWKAPDGYYQFDGVTKTDKTLNGSVVYKTNTVWNSLRLNLGKQLIDRRIVKVGEEFTYSVWMRTDQIPMKVRLFARFSGQSNAEGLTGEIALTNDWQKFSVTFKVTEKMVASQTKLSWVGFEQTTNNDSGKYVYYACNKLERGNIATDYSPAPEEYDSALSAAKSEIKQTTDAITASVSSVQTAASNAQSTANTAVSKADAAQAGVNTLDSTTVKSASLTINTDGIVMKAGKSTTDVANAIGSYFAVNQNAINLFSDKINVKGSMIVDGAITGDKIKANSVDVSKIVGIDANFIKSKIEYAMIDWLKGKTITAYNDNMTIDLQNGRISFKDGSNAVYRQTPDGIHTGFLHFEAGNQGGIYAAFGATSTRQGINSKSSEFAGIRCYRVSANGDSHEAKIDKIEVIGDTIQFGHGYISDGNIGGGFIMQAADLGSDIYSLNRVVKSIDALWRILHDHAKNTGYRFNDSAFINALNNEYNAWHDMRNQ